MAQRSEGSVKTPPTDVGGFERGLQRACGIGLAAFVVQGVAVGVAGFPLYPTWWWAGPGPAVVAATSLAAVECLRGRSRTPHRLAVAAVCAVGSVATALATVDTVSRMGSVVQPLVTGLVALLGLMDRPAIALPAGFALVGAQVGSMALTRPLDPPDVVIVAFIQCAVLLAASAAGVLARRGAAIQDRANERLSRALVADRAAARSRSDRREQERVLHDTVLSTLTALARGSLSGSPVLRARCGADAQVLQALLARGAEADVPDLVAALHEFARDMSVQGFVVAVSGAGPTDLPGQVATAIARAAGEAVSNAARHSGAAGVDVRIMAAEPGVTVEIVDHGSGTAPVDGRGLGERRSITERMGDVGGYARVDRTPGRGTRVVLGWPR